MSNPKLRHANGAVFVDIALMLAYELRRAAETVESVRRHLKTRATQIAKDYDKATNAFKNAVDKLSGDEEWEDQAAMLAAAVSDAGDDLYDGVHMVDEEWLDDRLNAQSLRSLADDIEATADNVIGEPTW